MGSTELTAGLQAQTTPGQVHSDAVSLEVSLKVHGSKVTTAGSGAAPQTEPFEEQTTSMIVFPHGGVLRMSPAVNSGQMLVLTNLKSRQDAICRVVKVRTYSNTACYVEIEFTHRQPGFWGVYFDGDGPAATDKAIEIPAAESSAATPKIAGAGSPRKASPEATAAASPGKPESSFISIGSREKVEPAASATSAPVSELTLAETALKSNLIPSTPSTSAGTARNTQQKASSTKIQEREATATDTLSETSQTGDVSKALSQRTSGEAFGERLTGHKEEAAGLPKSWIAIAACVGLLVIIGGGIMLFHRGASSSSETAASAPAVAPTAVSTSAADVTSQPVRAPEPVAAAAVSRPVPVATPANTPREIAPAVTSKPAKEQPASEASEQSEAATAPKKTVPSVFGTLNAHPVSTRNSTSGAVAPNLQVSSTEPNPLLGITSMPAPSALPPPGFKATSPVSAGGQIREPKLLTNVLPQYPMLAKQAHTEGDVSIQIVVDKAGNVSDAHVTSGPSVLREAALDAVRKWKYEPSLLDGQPTSVQMLVTVRFRL
jgi:TonB family protein